MVAHLISRLVMALGLAVAAVAVQAQDGAQLGRFLPDLEANRLVAGADGFGAMREDVPVAPVLKGGETVAWAFLTSDFAGTTG